MVVIKEINYSQSALLLGANSVGQWTVNQQKGKHTDHQVHFTGQKRDVNTFVLSHNANSSSRLGDATTNTLFYVKSINLTSIDLNPS